MCPRCHELETELAALKASLSKAGLPKVAAVARELGLTEVQANIVIRLQRAKGAPVDKDSLSFEVPSDDHSPALINAHVNNIRKRLGFDFIETIWGRGFRLSASGMARVGAALLEAA
jgi:DNA-binding response OmpR family regulator